MSNQTMQDLLMGPALEPPPGVKSDFVDAPVQSSQIIAISSLCLALTTVCVSIRAYTRFYIMRDHGWEDYTCFLAYVGFIVFCTIMLLPAFRGYAGTHQWNMRLVNFVDWTKMTNAISIAYVPIIFLAKLSILILFLRLFCTKQRTRTWWVIQGVVLFNFLFYAANLPVEIWPCVPRSKLWNPVQAGHCINNEAVFVAGGSINVVSDLMILLIPVVSILRLQMPLRRRLGICGVFATGIFGVVASVMHLVTSVSSVRSQDHTSSLLPVALWSTAEITSAILVSCLLMMPRFFGHILPKMATACSLLSHARPLRPFRRRCEKLSLSSFRTSSESAAVAFAGKHGIRSQVGSFPAEHVHPMSKAHDVHNKILASHSFTVSSHEIGELSPPPSAFFSTTASTKIAHTPRSARVEQPARRFKHFSHKPINEHWWNEQNRHDRMAKLYAESSSDEDDDEDGGMFTPTPTAVVSLQHNGDDSHDKTSPV